MPLSEHEQRLFEQIERSLAEDTKFASAVRSTDPRFHARRRIILSAIAALLGLAVLVYGVAIKNSLLGVAGFGVMLGFVALGIQAFRRGRHPELRSVGGTASRKTGGGGGGGGGGGSGRRGSFMERLEDRWRNRPESDQN